MMKRLLIITALALLLPAAGLCWTVTDALKAVVAAKNEGGGATPTITHDSDYYTEDDPTSSLSRTVDLAVGDLIVVVVGWSVDSTITITDDAGTPNTYNAVGTLSADGYARYNRIYYSVITDAKSSATVSSTWGTAQTSGASFLVMKFTKNSGTWTSDNGAYGQDYGGSASSSTQTTGYSNELLIVYGASVGWADITVTVGGQSPTIPAGQTRLQNKAGWYIASSTITDCTSSMSFAESNWVETQFWGIGLE